MTPYHIRLTLFLLVLAACFGAGAAPAIQVSGTRFVDATGRQILLHGLNAGAKHGDYMGWHGPEDFKAMRTWGMNCVRLLVIWAGLEPEPGQFDEAFLTRLDQRIQWAKEAGLYVLLDMHQDLYGEHPDGGGGDGAPAWAYLDGGVQHYKQPGASWGAAYLTSPRIQHAFDQFWKNAPAPDGIGVQDHFAQAWRVLAKRYADEPTVIGYDLLNEPFPGRIIGGITTAVLKVLPEILQHGAQAGDPHHRMIHALEEREAYDLLISAIEPLNRRFEEGPLADFHRRVATAIREVEQHKIIFITNSILSNFGCPSHVPAIVYGDGRREAQQAYAPHTYDLVTDTALSDHPSPMRIEIMVRRAAEHARELNMPLLNGEWGALYASVGAVHAAELVVAQLEKYQCSETYWDYHRHIEQTAFFKLLQRSYPEYTAGELVRYRLDPATGSFSVVWREAPESQGDTRIYLSPFWFSEHHQITLNPASSDWRMETSAEGEGRYLVLPSQGRAQERSLSCLPPNQP